MTKAPKPTEMSKGQSDNTHNATRSSIKQRLQTDLGRTVGVTTANQLVWLTGLRAKPSHSPQQPCNQKDKHLQIYKLTSLYRQQTYSHPKRRGHKNRYTYNIGDKYCISKYIHVYSDIQIGQTMFRSSGSELRSDG